MTQEERDDLLDRCYECGGYGDDYYVDEDGELVSACEDCWVTMALEEDED